MTLRLATRPYVEYQFDVGRYGVDGQFILRTLDAEHWINEDSERRALVSRHPGEFYWLATLRRRLRGPQQNRVYSARTNGAGILRGVYTEDRKGAKRLDSEDFERMIGAGIKQALAVYRKERFRWNALERAVKEEAARMGPAEEGGVLLESANRLALLKKYQEAIDGYARGRQ